MQTTRMRAVLERPLQGRPAHRAMDAARRETAVSADSGRSVRGQTQGLPLRGNPVPNVEAHRHAPGSMATGNCAGNGEAGRSRTAPRQETVSVPAQGRIVMRPVPHDQNGAWPVGARFCADDIEAGRRKVSPYGERRCSERGDHPNGASAMVRGGTRAARPHGRWVHSGCRGALRCACARCLRLRTSP